MKVPGLVHQGPKLIAQLSSAIKGYFFFFFGAALADFFAGAFFLVAMADLLHSGLLKVIIDQNLKIYASFFLLQN
jgi:hypothetical protein